MDREKVLKGLEEISDYMRLKAEGFNPDRTLFVNEWKEINKKISNTTVTANR